MDCMFKEDQCEQKIDNIDLKKLPRQKYVLKRGNMVDTATEKKNLWEKRLTC